MDYKKFAIQCLIQLVAGGPGQITFSNRKLIHECLFDFKEENTANYLEYINSKKMREIYKIYLKRCFTIFRFRLCAEIIDEVLEMIREASLGNQERLSRFIDSANQWVDDNPRKRIIYSTNFAEI